MRNGSFAPSDAWILASILWANGAEGTVTLDKIIGYGDAINHAVFEFAEIHDGLSRLSRAGLITRHGGFFEVAGPAREWRTEVKNAELTTAGVISWARGKLSSASIGPRPEASINVTVIDITCEEYSAGVARNHADMVAILKGLGPDGS